MEIKNKVVIVTGGSSGIGRATALAFANNHNKVIIFYKSNSEGAQQVVDEITSLDSEGLAIQVDISNQNEVKKVFEEIIVKYKTVDILINNAGGATEKLFLDLDEEALTDEFKNNFFGAIYCSQSASIIMNKNKFGRIINISSIYGMENHGYFDMIPYSAAKSAIANFTKTLAKGLAPHILVNAVAPGYVLTRVWEGLSPAEEADLLKENLTNQWIQPKEIAQSVLFLAQSDSITGQILVVDGGNTIK